MRLKLAFQQLSAVAAVRQRGFQAARDFGVRIALEHDLRLEVVFALGAALQQLRVLLVLPDALLVLLLARVDRSLHGVCVLGDCGHRRAVASLEVADFNRRVVELLVRSLVVAHARSGGVLRQVQSVLALRDLFCAISDVRQQVNLLRVQVRDLLSLCF